MILMISTSAVVSSHQQVGDFGEAVVHPGKEEHRLLFHLHQLLFCDQVEDTEGLRLDFVLTHDDWDNTHPFWSSDTGCRNSTALSFARVVILALAIVHLSK